MEQLSPLSLEELNKKKSVLKRNLTGLMASCLVIAMVHLYIFIINARSVSIGSLIPLLVLPISWMPLLGSLKSVNEEIKFRQSKELSNH